MCVCIHYYSLHKRMVGITERSCLPIGGPGRNKAKQTQSLLRRVETAEKQFCNDRNAVRPPFYLTHFLLSGRLILSA